MNQLELLELRNQMRKKMRMPPKVGNKDLKVKIKNFQAISRLFHACGVLCELQAEKLQNNL